MKKPEFTENWFDFQDLYEAFAIQFGDGKMVEVGTFEGLSAYFLLKEMHKLGKQGTLYLVDKWDSCPTTGVNDLEAVYQRCISNIGTLPNANQAEVMRMSSLLASAQFENESIDMVFIDAEHTYNAVTIDLAAWWPKVKQGGIIAGHDYIPAMWPGVVKAVNEFAAKNKLKVEKSVNSFFIFK